MNHYAAWWDDTITLYNKYTDPETNTVHWYRKVINDCFYKHSIEKLTVGKTTIETNVSTCRIRVDDAFIDKRAWNAKPALEKQSYFTLCTGDIIIAEEVDFEIDEYTKGKTSADLINMYKEWPGCFTVELVHINVGGGRGNEHYLARGT